MAEPIRLTPDRLLWRTRGQRWDYLFLARPVTPVLPGWFDLFCDVFPDSDSGPRPHDRRGTWTGGGVAVCYAAMVVDAQAEDWTRRPIRHFFLYALDRPQDAALWPGNWGELLHLCLAPVYQAVFLTPQGPALVDRIVAQVKVLMPAQLVLREEGAAPAAQGQDP